MAKKQPKQVQKITHVKLSRKDGEKFDFSKPLSEDFTEQKLSAPKIDSGMGGTYIELPEFLAFNATSKVPLTTTQLLLETENKEIALLESQGQTKKQKGVFDQYLKSENIFDLYRKKAGLKSLFFGIISTLCLVGIIYLITTISWAAALGVFTLGIIFVLCASLFFIVCVDTFLVHMLILVQALILCISAALFSQFTVVTLLVVLLFSILMVIAFKETERQQIINRIFDIFHNTRPASQMLNIAVLLVIFLASINFYSSTTSNKFYSAMISQTAFNKFLDNSDNNKGPLETVAKDVVDIKSYAEFAGDKPVTIQDFLIKYEYNNDINNVLSKAKSGSVARDPLLSSEEKAAKIQAVATKVLQSDLVILYSVENLPTDLLTKESYYQLLKQRVSNQLSSVSSDFASGNTGFFSISQKFPAIIVGVITVLAYSVLWWVYKFISSILNFFGLSLEKIIWWILIKLKFITIEHEKLDSEIIVV